MGFWREPGTAGREWAIGIAPAYVADRLTRAAGALHAALYLGTSYLAALIATSFAQRLVSVATDLWHKRWQP